MAASYRVTLLDRAGNRLGEMPPVGSGFSYGDVVNGGASATITPLLELPLYSGPRRGKLDGWASEVLIERLSGPGLTGPVHCGPVTQVHGDLDSRTLTVTSGGLFDWWLTERLITDDLTYTAREQTSLAADLLRRYSTGLGPAGDIRVDLATIATRRNVTQVYAKTDQKTPGQAVKDIATASGGFDFTVDLNGQPGGAVRRIWQPHYPEVGRHIATPLTAGKGGLRAFSLETATDIATRVFATGQPTTTATTSTATVDPAASTIIVGAQASPAVEAHYGIHVKPMQGADSTTKQVLQALANEYLSTRTPPVEIVSFQYRVSKARPFGFVGLGDTIPIQVRRGWLTWDGTARVIARTVTVDQNGGEIVACTAQGVDGGIS